MANPEQVKILKRGVEEWNNWRWSNPSEGIDLSEADLSEADLIRANLTGANFSRANLTGANFSRADLIRANFSRAYFSRADLSRANLSEADLTGAVLEDANLFIAKLIRANLTGANLGDTNLVGANLRGAKLIEAKLIWAKLIEADLSEADLTGADLTGADLRGANLTGAVLGEVNLEGASLIETNFTNANISGSRIFGISAWKLKVKDLIQSNLIITGRDEPEITVDNLEVAQFVYLLLHNEKLRDVIDTLTTKSVLILGRFTTERKAVLDAIRDELRKRGYIPILFDFEKPTSRDLTETVMTLASLARFVIADLSDPHSIPHELMSFAEKFLSVPVQPIFCSVKDHPNEYLMMEHLRRYPHVLPTYRYETPEALIALLSEKVIEPAEAKVDEVRPKVL